jgi:RND family efflux transporter MFP subunit
MNARNAVLLVAVLALAGCSKEDKKAEASSKPVEPLAVKTAVAETRQIDKAISVTGSLIPDETVTASFEVAGRIAAIYADFGQNVRKGQVLAELDKQELNLQVERSRAALAQAMARVGLDASQENVTPDSTPAIRQAVAQMEDARSKYESAMKLVKTGDISQERATELEKTFRARQAAVEASRDDLRTQWANVASFRADLKLAQKRLGDTVVRAPFDGAVTQKNASVGQYMKENTAILTLVKTNPMRLRVEVPETAAGAIRLGATLSFTTESATDEVFNAVVRELNPSLDSKSRSLTVEARLTKNDPRLRPGMFVQVQLVLSRNNEVVVVPANAIYTMAGLSKVFVVRNDKIFEHKITPGQEIKGWIEVPREEIKAGDEVAVSALPQLIQNAAVRATKQVGELNNAPAARERN